MPRESKTFGDVWEYLTLEEKQYAVTVMMRRGKKDISIGSLPFVSLGYFIPQGRWNSQGVYGRFVWKLLHLNKEDFKEVEGMTAFNGKDSQTYGQGHD